ISVAPSMRTSFSRTFTDFTASGATAPGPGFISGSCTPRGGARRGSSRRSIRPGSVWGGRATCASAAASAIDSTAAPATRDRQRPTLPSPPEESRHHTRATPDGLPFCRESTARRQAEPEARAFSRPALGPRAAAVPDDDAVHDGEAGARPGELVLRVQALEDLEELVGVRGIEARAVVLHAVDGAAVLGAAADLDARVRPPGAVLDRVADQVDPDLAHERR